MSKWQDHKSDVLTAFREDGYVSIPGFLNGEEVEEVDGAMAEVVRDVVPTLPAMDVFYEDKENARTLKQVQGLQNSHSVLSRYFTTRFKELAEHLLQDGVQGRNMQYFNKPPYVGQGTPAHQDGYFFKLEPSEAVTMWMALEEVDFATGCVNYVRGSHRRGMREHGSSNVLGFSQTILDFPVRNDIDNQVAFPASPGDLIVHHALTIHWASPNTTLDRTRKAIGAIFYADKAREDTALTAAYSKQLAEELKAKGRL